MIDMEFGKNLLLHCLEFFHVCLCDILPYKIFFRVCWEKLVVAMRNLISEKCSTYSSASCRFLNCWREFLGGEKYRRIIRFWYVGKVINFYLRNNQCVSRSLRKYVEKRVDKFIFINLKRWNFSGNDFGEESRHNFD